MGLALLTGLILIPFVCKRNCPGSGSRGGPRRILLGFWNRLSTHSSEKRKLKLRCDGGEACSPPRAGFSVDGVSVEFVDFSESEDLEFSFGDPAVRDLLV